MDGFPGQYQTLAVIRWSVSSLEYLPGGTSSPSIPPRPQWAGAHIATQPPFVFTYYSFIRLLFEQVTCSTMKRYMEATIRKRHNQKEIPIPKTEVGKN